MATKTPVVAQWIVLPRTGVQICRGLPLILPSASPQETTQQRNDIWRIARRMSRRQTAHELVRLIRDHIACRQPPEDTAHTDWLALENGLFVRLLERGDGIQLELVLDTDTGPGSQAHTHIPVTLQENRWLTRRRLRIADLYVAPSQDARNELGSLIMDFGNTASTFIFCRQGAGPLQAQLIAPFTPFDPRYYERSHAERLLPRSTMLVLRVDDKQPRPWLVLGKRAEELIREYPLTTCLYAPKKYIRHWPESLKAAEPTLPFRGILGRQDALHPVIEMVELTIEQMLTQVIAAMTNPQGTSDKPECYPRVTRLLATYPLTWRDVDRRVFKDMLERITRQLFTDETYPQVDVELVCSEPVAVAAYVLWEVFFHVGTANLALAASLLGNLQGTPEVRLLVIDIGGGSTDIACIDIDWQVHDTDQTVHVNFQLREAMRSKRAGDRLSHLIATALLTFVRMKYHLTESLDFQIEAQHPAFTRAYKRMAVAKIAELAESAKIAIASPAAQWALSQADEYELLSCFEPLLGDEPLEEQVIKAPHFILDRPTLKAWIEADQQSLKHSEPGFMDIFFYLEELLDSLRADQSEPHLVILSGRTTRLPFIKDMVLQAVRLPVHRIRTLDQLLPEALSLAPVEHVDKLAVVCGAQRFRYGDQIRFSTKPSAAQFRRYIGTVRETPIGLRLNKILITPGQPCPTTLTLTLEPYQELRIGYAFRADGLCEVIAILSNHAGQQAHTVQMQVIDDVSVALIDPPDQVALSEWLPAGSDLIADQFSDTGRIDGAPDGLLRRIVLSNLAHWQISP